MEVDIRTALFVCLFVCVVRALLCLFVCLFVSCFASLCFASLLCVVWMRLLGLCLSWRCFALLRFALLFVLHLCAWLFVFLSLIGILPCALLCSPLVCSAMLIDTKGTRVNNNPRQSQKGKKSTPTDVIVNPARGERQPQKVKRSTPAGVVVIS